MAILRKIAAAGLEFVTNANAAAHLSIERQILARRATALEGQQRIAFARAATSAVLLKYWDNVCAARGKPMPIRLGPVASVEVPATSFQSYADACAALETHDAFFQIGELYTSLLPDDHRTRHGVYYTPPPLVKRLLDLAEMQGVDWKSARVLDPACGGAAFAAYVAQRMLAANAHLPAEARLRDIQQRLVGLDIDPFATWLSAVLLDVVCLSLLTETQTLFDGVIRQADSLAQSSRDLGQFDLVIGNPPYGKITLMPDLRARFSRSLHGHANLYGLFTDAAVELTKPKGLIAFVTPTSFLGGEYFKNLRTLLRAEASPIHASFVSKREGVFSNVLQETALTLFRRSARKRSSATSVKAVRLQVESVITDSSANVQTEPLGKVTLSDAEGAPWVLPRSRAQLKLVRCLVILR
jgi:predicted RNA methylase